MAGATRQRTAALDMMSLCERLFPISRSITGPGVRQTLSVLQEYLPLTVHEVPSGTQVFDWQVPLEWHVREAFIENSAGQKVVDFANHNLHLVHYSQPIDAKISRQELDAHLHSLPEQPELIPYRTSYYQDTWGFCLSHRQRLSLTDSEYRVCIRSELKAGSLTYAELYLPGSSGKELLISTHICHPSLANDNLSGIAVATQLAAGLHADWDDSSHGIRFIFIPGTIGAITWLAVNEQLIPDILAGLVLSGVGDKGPLTYKRSRSDNGLFDQLFAAQLQNYPAASVRPYLPYGYDERQFCSPGINIPAGCLMRTPYGEYPEYHSSGDNLSLLDATALEETVSVCREVVCDALRVHTYQNLNPKCEPQLGRRGLYDQVGGENQSKEDQMALLWMLSYADGQHSTLDIHRLSGLSLAILDKAAKRLLDTDLLQREARA